MVDLLIPSLEVVLRTLAADVAYTMSRMQVLERIEGNPVGVAYRWLDDGAVALTARIPAFARVIGLRAGLERHIEPVVQWYRAQGVRPTFEAVPGLWSDGLGRELARHGYYQSGFHAALIGAPAPAHPAAAPAGDGAAPAIEVVTTPDAMEGYLDAYVAGWGIPEADHPQFKSNVRPWLHQPGWTLYLARMDGRPAAAATLYAHGSTAYLADAATDPAFRGRGLQQALLRRRMHDAGLAGADLLCSGAYPLSASHRNMERVGLQLQFNRAKWTPT